MKTQPSALRPVPATPRQNAAARDRDPAHKFHGRGTAHDARADVAASGNRQRLRAHRPGSAS